MRRRNLFVAPYRLWANRQTFYVAIVNGERQTLPALPGNWRILEDAVNNGRKAAAAAKAAERRAAAKAAKAAKAAALAATAARAALARVQS
jgi:hypothetical protein